MKKIISGVMSAILALLIISPLSVLSLGAVKPATPVLVSAVNATNGITVKWKTAKNAQGYYVFRKTTGSWAKIGTLKSSKAVSFTDKTVKSGTKYTYTVKAYNDSANSAHNKNGVSSLFLKAPKASVKNALDGVTVTWASSQGAKTYYVYRKTTGSWSRIATLKSDVLTFTDKNVKSGTTYTYTVKVGNGSTYSAYYSGKAIKYLSAPALKAVTAAKDGLNVSWGKVTGASGYYVYRKSGSAWSKIATVKSASTLTYKDKNVASGTAYTYTVKAFSGSIYSAHISKGISGKGVFTPVTTVPDIINYYKTSLDKARTTAKTATLTYDGAINYNGIFEAGKLGFLGKKLIADAFEAGEKSEEVDPAALPPGKDIKCNLSPSSVKSATCTDKGSYYLISIVMKDEKNPVAGKGMGSVVPLISQSQITSAISSTAGVSLSDLQFTYYGAEKATGAYKNGNVICKINKATGNMTYMFVDAPAVLSVKIKAGTVDFGTGKVGIETVSEYKIAY